MSIGNDYPVILLGHTGMLGHVVQRYLMEKGHSVIVLDNRINNLDDLNNLSKDIKKFVESKNYLVPIINCVGIVKNKADKNPYLTTLINTYVPKTIHKIKNAKLIQISTDCVFNGKNGPYSTHNKPNAEDLYGITKAMGERGIVLRTSIIGPENNKENKNSGGLYAFAKNATDKVPGYINHIWSGVTTLELAKIINAIVSDKLVIKEGIHHVRCHMAITKYNLLKFINPKINIYPEQTEISIDRELINRNRYLTRASIQRQLEELEKWYYAK